MCVCARLLLLAALPALAGRASWCADGEVVSVTESAPAPGGGAVGGPAFAPRQRTAAVAAVGQPAALHCRVLRLGDKAVSWVRSSDLQILTHAGYVFTADARVSAAESAGSGAGAGASAGACAGGRAGASCHSLHIERLRLADAGRYECQVNTEPKMSLFFNLTVLDEPVPSVVVSAGEKRVVRGVTGGAATLVCEARYEPEPRALPLPPLDVRWRRADARSALSLQSARGGISLDTDRWTARVVSRLTLAELRPADAGEYECSAGDVVDSVHLVLTDAEEHMEMQRDESASGAAPVGAGGAVLVALAAAALLAAARPAPPPPAP